MERSEGQGTSLEEEEQRDEGNTEDSEAEKETLGEEIAEVPSSHSARQVSHVVHGDEEDGHPVAIVLTCARDLGGDARKEADGEPKDKENSDGGRVDFAEDINDGCVLRRRRRRRKTFLRYQDFSLLVIQGVLPQILRMGSTLPHHRHPQQAEERQGAQENNNEGGDEVDDGAGAQGVERRQIVEPNLGQDAGKADSSQS